MSNRLTLTITDQPEKPTPKYLSVNLPSLARRMQCNKAGLWQVFRCDRVPNMHRFKRIADTLEVSLDELYVLITKKRIRFD